MTHEAADMLQGPWRIGWPEAEPAFVLLVDPVAAGYLELKPLLSRARQVHVLEGRPTIAEADLLVDLLLNAGVGRLVSVGAGLVIDTGKLAAYRLRSSGGPILDHCAVPCGAEPYRAITPFSMYERDAGSRDAVWEEWLRPEEIAVVPSLLARMSDSMVQLFAGDSLVHAVESVLSKLSTTESEALALAAAETFGKAATASAPDRVALLLASMNAARAFDVTKLGLAHALSRPLGIAAGISHDCFNLMLGPAVVSFWGSDVIVDSALRSVQSVAPTAARWSALIDGYRQRAGLPERLADAGLREDDVVAAVGWAPNSSGIPNLPHPLKPGDLQRIMRAAWDGSEGLSSAEGSARRE